MKLFLNKSEFFDTEAGVDLSIPLRNGAENAMAWYAEPVDIQPVVQGDFIGDVNQGGPVNFKTIKLNPHGNGTHTECVGHISSEPFTINQCLKSFHFLGQVITVQPDTFENPKYDETDLIITKKHIEASVIPNFYGEILVMRTLPNEIDKKHRNYSNANPPYLLPEAMTFINELGIKHLMVDMPSVDRESDDGVLQTHHMFWDYPENPQLDKTITEMVYVPNELQDGPYLFQIQIMSLEMDASPSKILAHRIQKG
ncbi:cyclase family protein [Crocinitomicaceae bacterium]|jgi:arylformamidase|nr:cyclase family protein [Crocinitomicaceae bacterium]